MVAKATKSLLRTGAGTRATSRAGRRSSRGRVPRTRADSPAGAGFPGWKGPSATFRLQGGVAPTRLVNSHRSSIRATLASPCRPTP